MTYSQPHPTDNFTEHDVISCLEAAGKRFKNGSRYILAQCPTHDDTTPSAQIYKDDWFVNCHAICGRYHITKAYPELRRNYDSHANRGNRSQGLQPQKSRSQVTQTIVSERKYTTYDLMEEWQKMPLIPGDHNFKGLPIEELNGLGWRWDEARNSYFIPYFSRSKQSVPFAQWRHLSGDRRFTFLKDAKPTCYGTWNLTPKSKLFVVEGASDCAVLQSCMIPWIGLPSAASGELMRAMATFCRGHGIELVYAGDNDEAGDKLREALESVMSYRIKQPPKEFKDWGDFYEAKGSEAVTNYCLTEFRPAAAPDLTDEALRIIGGVIMPDDYEIIPSVVISQGVGMAKHKEQLTKPTVLY